ncbi:chemotaxis-specific protein-glutamate methyltransferase CheB [Thauera aromatica]|uniref:chemotaxis-specific protein-glutamate methyltransferase CheB n=1 Tax=Thauera aromatica TaxID=59405 RepID=UPI001FFD40CE|nr:chemotaxis-specific protein-glutamate methyltransferase CheB [Thauera aromatica]MCK2094906.1 chemotaxis-specific protein-glutamate methyltransferase CheB [Thauera aromatica]
MNPAVLQRPLRVLVADDSAVARGLIRACLEHDRGIEIVAEAGNGLQAVELAQTLRPDLVTMDLDMPVLGGLEAIERIMADRAVPILVITSADDAAIAGEAIQRGALEVVRKPRCNEEQARDLVARIRLLAGVPVITRRFRIDAEAPAPRPAPVTQQPFPAPAGEGAEGRIVAIAASTGGPQALARILPRLPSAFRAPVVVAQHISEGFAEGLVGWLAGLCALPVVLACDGQRLEAGHVYVSPPERNLVVTAARRLALVEPAATDVHHPSCDVLLRSVAEVFGAAAIGVILSGMGRDGARGLGALRAAGGVTIAQDEASSVVFGMNRVAIEQGAVEHVLPVDRIGDEILALLAARRGR